MLVSPVTLFPTTEVAPEIFQVLTPTLHSELPLLCDAGSKSDGKAAELGTHVRSLPLTSF